ncbi:ATP-binding cassette domain-containing protein [Pseudomonas sp. LB3P38]|uniref:ATP-binding cassette domain-containing protein n=1 Tax=Pseudomonas lyxosi TaxID=3398358 RepID=UPI0039F0D00D
MAEKSSLAAMIEVVGACQNNLRNISVSIPVGELTVFTGVSGSGKSSLVFGVLAAESQRQLNFTYPAYVRNRLPHLGTPHVQHIAGLSTAIIIDQKSIGANSRSTVGTATDSAPLLRLIFSRMGQPSAGFSPAFSFNDPAGMCPHCEGLGEVLDVDETELIDLDKSINEGAFNFRSYEPGSWYWRWYKRTGLFDPDKKLRDYSKEDLELLLYAEPGSLKNPPPDWYSTAKYEGIVHRFRSMYLGEISETRRKRLASDLDRIIHRMKCPVCLGARLNQAALDCRIGGLNIDELSWMPVKNLLELVRSWKMPEVAPAIENLTKLLDTMVDLGLGYLQLARTTPTLSGGEAQRIKMVRHLGSSLTRFTYILDEPSTGLHPRDVRHLGEILIRLRDKGNTVLVVEHDPDIIEIADMVVEMGPGAGDQGGLLLFDGSLPELLRKECPTASYLNQDRSFLKAREPKGVEIKVRKGRRNNLRSVDVEVPAGVLTVITGVAGSGKSSLVQEMLIADQSVLLLDQSPMRGSVRSTVATYIGVMDAIRNLFAKANSVSAGWFSSSSKGACPTCKGRGLRITELAFLDSTETECEACAGTGFNDASLSFRLGGKSIAQVLAMRATESKTFFYDRDQEIVAALNCLEQVGLGHLSIGRSTSTLSGGERQRVKLAMTIQTGTKTLVLDEPTTGLHGLDVQRLLSLLGRLVADGTTVIIVEHNLDSMLAADWIIDMGPGAGDEGGQVVYNGPAREIIHASNSRTGEELKRYIARDSASGQLRNG